MTMFAPMNKPISDWAGQRLWIIGASSGIGAALAQQAIAAGAQVALSARRVDLLQRVANASPAALVVPLDVLDPQAWTAAYQQIRATLGDIDLLIFCAADYRPERSWEVSMAAAESTLRVNLGSVYGAVATVLPDMLTRGCGGIALIASVAGYMGLPNASSYGPSKAALINLAEILYGDLHPKGLNVYLINPGFVKTELTDKNKFAMPGLQTPYQAATEILRGMRAGRFEIHFPWRFTTIMKLVQVLPYRWRFALFSRFLKTS
jgi:short-subunit dehydrogenase